LLQERGEARAQLRIACRRQPQFAAAVLQALRDGAKRRQVPAEQFDGLRARTFGGQEFVRVLPMRCVSITSCRCRQFEATPVAA
jgi:hypothetical protein